jgi:hypothetical protein
MSDLPRAAGQIVTGPLFNEPMRVETIRPNGHNGGNGCTDGAGAVDMRFGTSPEPSDSRYQARKTEAAISGNKL